MTSDRYNKKIAEQPSVVNDVLHGKPASAPTPSDAAPAATEPPAMTEAYINKADVCRHLLPDPGPIVVGEMIAEIRRLHRALAVHADAARDTKPAAFVREPRYLVFKIKDANEHLFPDERVTLERLLAKCSQGRIEAGKHVLECVVVESDWPEYAPTWAAIKTRVEGKT